MLWICSASSNSSIFSCWRLAESLEVAFLELAFAQCELIALDTALIECAQLAVGVFAPIPQVFGSSFGVRDQRLGLEEAAALSPAGRC